VETQDFLALLLSSSFEKASENISSSKLFSLFLAENGSS